MQFIKNTLTNNIMEKLIIILIVAFLGMAVYSQSATVKQQEYTVQTINGAVNDTIVFNKIQGEFDVSIQLIPALAGEGDSVHFSHVIQQSNSDGDAVWTAITTSATVSTVRDGDALISITDFKGLRLRAILTGISTDTIAITPYTVYKKHKKE